MITSLLSQLPPGTGVLCLALAAALGWCRASRWKSRYHELNRNLRSQAEENNYLRKQFDRMWNDNDGVLGNARKDDKEQIEFLRTRLTELLPAPVANWRDTLIRRPVKSDESVCR